jgi:hypothetical protein
MENCAEVVLTLDYGTRISCNIQRLLNSMNKYFIKSLIKRNDFEGIQSQIEPANDMKIGNASINVDESEFQ